MYTRVLSACPLLGGLSSFGVSLLEVSLYLQSPLSAHMLNMLQTHFLLCASTGSVPGRVSLMVEEALTSYVLTVLGQTLRETSR